MTDAPIKRRPKKKLAPLHQRMEAVTQFDIPIWVYDPKDYKIRWANQAALALWDADNYLELSKRDFTPISNAAKQRLQQYLSDLDKGLTVMDLWTVYPKGKPISIRYRVLPITLDCGNQGFICQGMGVVDMQPDTLHSVQALIHTSFMVSIYDTRGEFIFANPAARVAATRAGASLRERFVEPEIMHKMLRDLDQYNTVKLSAQIYTATGVEWHDIEASYSQDAITGERVVLLSETNATEKHHFKETQKYSDTIFKSMVSTSIDAVLVCHRQQVILANDAAAAIFHINSGKALQNRSLLEFFPKKYHPVVEQVLANSLHNNEKHSAVEEAHALRNDNEEFAVQMVAVSARLEGKTVSHIVLRDIDVSRRALRALSRSDDKLRRTIDSIGDGIISTNDKGEITAINATAELMTGWPAGSAIGHKLCKIFVPDSKSDQQGLQQELKLAMELGKSVTSKRPVSLLPNQGNKHYVVYTLLPTINLHNSITGVELVFRDFTELQLTNERLSLMQAIIDNGADSAFILNDNADIVYCNRTACSRYSYSQSQFKTMKVFAISPGLTPEIWPIYWEKIRREQSFNIESSHVTNTGEVVDVEISVNHFKQGSQEHCLIFVRDISERKRDQEKIIHLAHHDALTGLPNRLLLLDRFSQLIKNADRYQYKVAALFLDLDNFKQINDAMGHAAGDQVLKMAAERLRHCLRQDDTISRLGGDEFVILASNVQSTKDIEIVAQQLIDKFAPPFTLENNQTFHISTSIGIAIYPDDGESPSELLRLADMAMYKSKGDGRSRYSRFKPEMNLLAKKRLSIYEKLRRALSNGELQVHYQPIIDLKTDNIIGAESLLRWHSKELGPVAPAEFIPLAEESGLIIPIGQFVLQEALTQLKCWQQLQNQEIGTLTEQNKLGGDKSFKVSVNVSARQLSDSNFCRDLRQLLQRSGVNSRDLIVEITESVLITSSSQAEATVKELASMDIELAMDDFGTGYSSLTYLRRFAFSILKLDRDYVDGVANNKSDNELVKASIAMAQSMNLKVIAEGVENREQCEKLKQMQAHWAQGFYFAKALSADKIKAMLVAENYLA